MNEILIRELARRRSACCQFYYASIGQTLKKKRLELKMTQETLAIGICSNTYLSKIENNQIVVNREHLYLIMERMGMDMETIRFPEEIIEYLEKSIELFFYKDIEAYKELFEEVSKYQFSILLQIIKLGYYTLIEDYENGKLVYSEIFKYLQSLEEFGFTVFLVYASIFNVTFNDYKNARFILERIGNRIYNDEMLYGLVNYSRYLVYGNLNLQVTSTESGNIALNIFNKHSNIKRVNEYFLWRDIFTAYEGDYNDENFKPCVLKNIDNKNINYYLTVLASCSEEPEIYLNNLVEEGSGYLLGLFVKARHYLINDKQEEFKEIYNKINTLHYQLESKIDYAHILKLMKNKEETMLKDYLINYVLDQTMAKQNIYFTKIVTVSISNILTDKKRYKDALIYREKFEDFKSALQLSKQVSILK
ncbi:MAG: helix-turn-helix transcriptional regulator [Candidatus Izemoplasmatales bacterium]